MTNLSIAEEIASGAANAVDWTETYFCETLDFSESSIAVLEAAVEDVDDLIPGGDSAENIELISWLWGSYIGEVLRRHIGGEWLAWEDEYGQAIAFQSGGLKIFPHDKVRKRLVDGDEHDLERYYQVFRGLMSPNK
jgi:Domain of unknown function (DUF3806)